MKIAVISDVHSNLIGLNLALEDSKKEHVDKYIFLGDYITDGYISNEIIDLVKEYGDYNIQGNRERYIMEYNPERKDYYNYKTISTTYESLSKESISFIKSLKSDYIININNYRILIIHGDKYCIDRENFDYDKMIRDFKDFDVCLLGHTHIYKDEVYQGKRFINPGSIGIPTDSPSYKYCILDIDDGFKVYLKEFKTEETYQNLEKSFINSDYYITNPIWSDLVLRTIKYGKDCCYDFIELLTNKIYNKEYTVEKFNKAWEKTYYEFISTYDFE